MNETIQATIKKQVSEYLSKLKPKAINNYKVEAKQRTWEEVYPGKVKRIFAKFTYWLVNKNILHNYYSDSLNTDKYKWYHFVFPFNKSIELIYPDLEELKDKWYYEINCVPNQDDFATCEEVNRTWENIPPTTDWLLENYKPTIINKIYIEDPSKYLDVDMYIQPIQAVEMIRVNFILDNKGGQN